MKQYIPVTHRQVDWTSTGRFGNLIGGTDLFNSDTFGDPSARVPIPIAGTFRKLHARSGDSRTQDVAATVYKNNSVTTLEAILLASETSAFDDLHEVTIAAGDDVYLNYGVAVSEGAIGKVWGIATEWEGAAEIFGMPAPPGNPAAGSVYAGGALGNGISQGYASIAAMGSALTNTYSIAGVSGTLTTMVLKEMGTNAGGGWIGYLRVNGVLQDGTGGTVDTAVTLADGGGFAIGSFSLHIEGAAASNPDHVEFVVLRTGTNASFNLGQVACGVAFVPDVDGQFMLVGGSNNSITAGSDAFTWVGADQLQTTEQLGAGATGLTEFTIEGMYVEFADPAPGTFQFTLRINGIATSAVVNLTGGTGVGLVSGLHILVPAEGYIAIRLHPSDPGAGVGQFHWGIFANVSTTPSPGIIGPLAWWHRRKRLTDGTVVSTPHSDWDMQCPAEWYEGFKEADVLEFGDAVRRLSDPVTGDPVASTFRLRQNDTSRTLLEELASAENRYWVGNHPVYMTTRENRAQLGRAYCVFNGPIIDYQPDDLTVEFTLGDALFQKLLTDAGDIPWRQYKDSNLSQFTEISESLDLEAPEAIGYGRMRRVPGVSPASPEGFIYVPTLLGKINVGGVPYWCWQAFGHAVKSFVDAYTIRINTGSPPEPSSILGDEGTIWLIPGYGGHNAAFGQSYQDVRSDTYGNLRRVTRIYGKVGEADPDACAAGTLILALAVDGIETIGDSTGDLITDRFDQRFHFMVNFLAHAGPESYQSGAWLTNPTWSLIEGDVDVINEDSFTAAKAIAAIRLPAVPGSPVQEEGYVGAGIIGAHGGDRLSAATWDAEWNKSCSTRSGFNNVGQYVITMLHPTQAIKDAAPLIEETNDILLRSFQTPIMRQQQSNRVPFRADYEHTTGRWMTSDHADDESAVVNYNEVILGQERQYRFAPGITQAYHLALMAAREFAHAPRGVSLSGTVGPDPNGDSIGYLDLGGYFRYRHFASISSSADEIRLAWIGLSHQVQAGRRIVRIEAIDVEDLIGFDLPPDESGSPAITNDECINAIDMGDLSTPFDETYDTTGNGTDTSHGSPSFGGSGIGYHAAWFKFTPFTNGFVHLATTDSDYDTQMVLFTGTCAGLTVDDFNDNYGALKTSVIDRAVNSGQTYYVLVAGYGPDDGGHLRMFADLTAP